MRLRQVTAKPLALCFEFLAALGADERRRYVEHFETHGESFFIDPVELDPSKAEVIAALKKEATELDAAGKFGRGMGRGGRMHCWVKEELQRRHGIAWKTVSEMNPEVAFD